LTLINFPRKLAAANMTASEFKTKWGRVQGKETSMYQSHFDDLCEMLSQKKPLEADPSGKDFFCYQKHVTKSVQPGIMGTLFENALEFEEGGKLRAQLGAHYTGEDKIRTIVEPVLMAPLRREWAVLKATLLPKPTLGCFQWPRARRRGFVLLLV
jgi:hypothetical protein